MKQIKTPPPPIQQLKRLLDGIAQHRFKKVIVMAGAGISTAAGIPDFRSPKTGLYDNLQRLNLPYPEAVFDIEYLRKRPEAFFMLAEEMYPSQFEPTTFHRFLRWISDNGALRRVYTQNIDTLERLAGVPGDKIVEAHGSFAAVHCIDCGHEADKAEVDRLILAKTGHIPRCRECNGIVKPDIVFFGEGLPERFFDMQETDFDDVDLAIVAGTSLQVSPFNQLPDMVPRGVPRVLLNLDRVGTLGRRPDDLVVLGNLTDLDSLLQGYIDGTKETQSATPLGAKSEISGTKAGEAATSDSGTQLPEGQHHESKDTATHEPQKPRAAAEPEPPASSRKSDVKPKAEAQPEAQADSEQNAAAESSSESQERKPSEDEVAALANLLKRLGLRKP